MQAIAIHEMTYTQWYCCVSNGDFCVGVLIPVLLSLQTSEVLGCRLTKPINLSFKVCSRSVEILFKREFSK